MIQSLYIDDPEERAGHGEGMKFSVGYRKGREGPARLLSE